MDGTLVAGDCGVLFVRHLVARGLVPAREMFAWGRWAAGVARHGLHEREVASAKRLLLRMRARMGERRTEAIYDQLFTETIRPRLRERVVAELREAQADGAVFIVTANLRAMAIRLGRELGISEQNCLGAEPLLDENGNPGEEVRLPIPMEEERARLLRQLAGEHGVPLEQTKAYGDSLHDVPMLRAAGRPCAVHPGAALRRLAEAERWRIIAGPPQE